MTLANSRLAHYDVVSLIGVGGMGELYRATDIRLHRDVALKVLPAALAADPERIARFKREARAVAALNHPNIVTIHSVEEADGVHFLTMELLEGRTLHDVLAGDPLSPEQFLAIAEPLADAVAAAHAAGITHRDLKPQNVMFGRDGRLKVLDFGLAKFHQTGTEAEQLHERTTMVRTQEGMIVGTVPYMSPEQAEGNAVDARSDVFSLGTMFYQMATGRRPFGGTNALAVLVSILRDTPAPVATLAPGLPAALHEVIDRCMSKNRDARYPDAAALRQALRNINLPPRSSRAVSSAAGASRPRSGRAPLVGRDVEHETLARHLKAAAGSTGMLVLLGGEPGVGKTRLAEELLRDARAQGMLALKGHCYEAATTPFSPFVELLEQMLRDVPPTALREALGGDAPEVARLVPQIRRVWDDLPEPSQLAPEQHRRILFNAILDLLRRLSARQTLVVLLDDLHWADEATVELLLHVSPHLPDMRVLLVGTYRDIEFDVGKPFEKALAALVRHDHVVRVPVRRLPQAAVAELLSAFGGSPPPGALVKAIFDETEGNPFFVGEVFQHLSEEGRLFDETGIWKTDLTVDALDVPEGVRLVIGRRLERLRDMTPAVLTTAAVVGRRFGLQLVEALGPLHGDAFIEAIEEAESAKLIVSERAGRETFYAFTHELIRHTLLAALSPPRRQRLEASVAKAIEVVYASSLKGHAAAIAHHLYEAGPVADAAQTVRFLVVASDEAVEAGALEAGLAHIERALSLVGTDQATRVSLLWKRGLARRALGHLAEAIADWEAAVQVSEVAAEPGMTAVLSHELAHSYAWTGQPMLGVAAARRGLAALGADASANRCRLLGSLGWNLSIACDFEAADPVIRDARTMAEALGDSHLRGELLLVTSWHDYLCMRRHKQADACRQAVEFLRPTRDVAKLAEALGNIQMAAIQLGHPGDIASTEAETRRLAERLGRFDIRVHQLYSEALRDWITSGHLGRFVYDLRLVMDVIGAWGWLAEAVQSQTMLWHGDVDAAIEQARVSLSHEPPVSTHTGLGWGMLFLSQCSAGQREPALALLAERATDLPRAGRLNTIGSWCALFKVIEGLAVLDEPRRVAEYYPLVVEALANETAVTFDGSRLIETLAGLTSASAGQWDVAEKHYQTALRLAGEMPFVLEQAEVRYWYARMLLDRGTPATRRQAAEHLETALSIYRTIGMPRHVQRAEALALAAHK